MMNDFAEQLKKIRKEQRLSMQSLADEAGVSKSLISKIEAGNVSPSLDVSVRLAHALGTSLSAMLREETEQQVIKIEKGQHIVWKDPVDQVIRENLSPGFTGSRIEWARVTLPAKQHINTFPVVEGLEKYFLIEKGKMDVCLGNEIVSIAEGDTLYFKASREHYYVNTGDVPVVFYLILHQAL